MNPGVRCVGCFVISREGRFNLSEKRKIIVEIDKETKCVEDV